MLRVKIREAKRIRIENQYCEIAKLQSLDDNLNLYKKVKETYGLQRKPTVLMNNRKKIVTEIERKRGMGRLYSSIICR